MTTQAYCTLSVSESHSRVPSHDPIAAGKLLYASHALHESKECRRCCLWPRHLRARKPESKTTSIQNGACSLLYPLPCLPEPRSKGPIACRQTSVPSGLPESRQSHLRPVSSSPSISRLFFPALQSWPVIHFTEFSHPSHCTLPGVLDAFAPLAGALAKYRALHSWRDLACGGTNDQNSHFGCLVIGLFEHLFPMNGTFRNDEPRGANQS